MKSLVIGLCLAMSATLPVVAVDWEYVATTEDGTTLSVDVDSIVKFNRGYSYTIMMISESENKYLVVYDGMLCKERLVKTVGYNSYTRNGEFIKSNQNPENPFRPILVNSIYAALWERLCN
ncbi:surface-adhesin E family protein [Nostoc sp.]|uniref:surface-adhesin E family protein n=1 Tax=Nostoc sp. TaxID=1180 RepID=UPI002FFA82DD